MRGTLKIFGWVVLAGIALVAPSYADLQTGYDAYGRGDYATALKELRPLAEGGNAEAQLTLGLMYKMGQGVPQDYVKAAEWMHRSAKQGQSAAQGFLGVMYAGGQGVPQDYVKAHAYFAVAGAQGQTDGFTARTGLEKLMPPADIAEARRMASECAKKEYKGCEFWSEPQD